MTSTQKPTGDQQLPDLPAGCRLVHKRLETFFENETLIQSDYFSTIEVEESQHPLVQDPKTEVVMSFPTKAKMAGADGFLSPGSVYHLADNATTLLIMARDPTFRNNVTLSLDLKRIAPIPVGKKLFLRCKTTVYNSVFATVSFEIIGDQNELGATGFHTKVYVGFGPQKL